MNSAHTQLHPDVLLHRQRELDITLEMNGEISVHIGEQSVRLGPLALSALDTFAQPKTMRDGILSMIQSQPNSETVDDSVNTLRQLISIGALQVGETSPTISDHFFPFGFYDSPGVQIKILNDRKRRQAFLQAVKETVRPGDVVLDLGSGSGILGIAAAQAGARKVYAVEPSGMAGVAKQVAEQCGLGHVITTISNWSHLIDLPEKCDVLLFDIVGSEPLEMRAIETSIDAMQRHLKPFARIVPQGVKLKVILASAPPHFINQYIYDQDEISMWQKWYGMDFSPMMLEQSQLIPVHATPETVNHFDFCSELSDIWTVRFRDAADYTNFTATSEIRLEQPVQFNTVVGVVQISLSDNTTFSADPRNPGDAPHWMTPLWISGQSLSCTKGDKISVRYTYLGRGRSQVQLFNEKERV